MENTKIDNLCIESLKTLSAEQITKAQSGHPGVALGSSAIMHTLFSRHIAVTPKDSKWFNRDRFILAAGHGSSLLYSMLHVYGFDISNDDLMNFRQLHAKCAGHPEVGLTDGVDCTSGPLGQGIPEAVGMSLCQMFLKAKFNRENYNVCDHYTYVLCGDGDLQEGLTQEAISFAGHNKIEKLIVLYDSNDIQLDGPVNGCNSENVKGKFESMGWKYFRVNDGSNVDEIDEAIKMAKEENQPVLIEIKTIIGAGSKLEGTSTVHGKPLSQEEVDLFRSKLGGKPFYARNEVYEFYKDVKSNNDKKYDEYTKMLEQYKQSYPDVYEDFMKALNNQYTVDFDELVDYQEGYNKATRVSCGDYIKKISEVHPTYIGGSADLTASTYAKGLDGNFSSQNHLGRNILFGVREHAMAAICNGMMLHGGVRVFCGGFFVFSDYLKPALRLSSLMNLPVTYIFSHDSVCVGEDGPTHEPIEQITMLRSIPNCNVIRPCDVNEMRQAMKISLEQTNTPTVILTSRQNLPLVTGRTNGLSRGGYIVKEESHPLDGIIIASGSEVSLALKAQEELEKYSIGVRVVSMPSIYLFDKQPQEYKDSVLPKECRKRMAVEMSDATHMYKYIGLDGVLFNINTFGVSGKLQDVVEYFNFNTESVVKAYKDMK